ncbi:MAG: hypothetical protein IJW54_05535 [Clostridia bacterium]|nr:hypothetical protein [Clostridia bacterium]
MKKLGLLIGALALICIMLVSCGESSDVPDGMMQASCSDFYTLYVPDSWQINQSTEAVVSAQPHESERTNVSVMYWSTSQGYSTHADFIKEYKAQLDLAFTGVTFIEEGTKSELGLRYPNKDTNGNDISPYDAKDYVYVAKLGKLWYKYHVTVAIDRGIFYVVTYTFLQDNPQTEYEKIDDVKFSSYDSYRSTIKDISSAFKIK